MLTKSNYLLGLQCPKLLWVAKNNKERIPELDKLAKKKLKEGELIGEFAKKLFSEGIDLSGLEFNENLKNTQDSLKQRKPIFEAGFVVEELFSRADILVPVGKDEWDIIEVKSATKIKDINIHDVCFQKYVYEKVGLKIRNCILMHVDNEYVLDNEIKPKDFFVKTDISDKVEEFSEGIEKRVENMIKIINSGEEPKVSIGVYCSDPYNCPLKQECWKDVPDASVFELYRMFSKKKFELYNSGIVKLSEIPDSVKLNDKQKIQRLLVGKQEKHVDKKQIEFFLKKLEYPIYYLDFETINPAIPKFNGMKPYQRIPFQFSLHIQEKQDGELKHFSFLADGTDDPRPKFMQALKENLGEKGSILVYNQGFEKGVMNEGATAFSEFKDWYEKNILPRIKDLWDIFRNFWYYDSKQKGSASIKYVLPVFSDLSYNEMQIKKGDVASYEWERITFLENVSDEEKKKVRNDLGKYCELDTFAEVEIVRGLWEILKVGEYRK